MNQETATALTDEERDIKIAELCGYFQIYHRKPSIDNTLVGWKAGCFGGGCAEIPHYSTDLNAMHEAEKTMTGPYYGNTPDGCLNQQTQYPRWLQQICASPAPYNATARQRAIAFIVTMT
jgi:hypothetical protein